MPPRRKERSLDPYFTKSGQGKLFYEPADGPQQAAQQEKKGRRNEMLAAMPQTKVFESDPLHGEVKAKIQQRGKVAEQYEFGDHEIAEHNVATRQAGTQRRADMARELADQTTVHPDNLRELHQVSEGQYAYGQLPDGKPDMLPRFAPGSVAHYDQQRHASGPVIEAPKRMDLGTLTHEIGHHVSRHHNRNTGTGEARAHLEGGLHVDLAEEGRADAFALEHAPSARQYTYASNALSTGDRALFSSPDSRYRQEREWAGQPLRDWEGGSFRPPTAADSLSPQEFEHQELFETEPAYSPEADVEVQAYTRKRGAEVLGWGPNRYGGVGSIQKHEYDPSGESEFWGANYVSMFDADVVPDRRMEDYHAAKSSWPREPERAPKQLWRDR